MRSSRPRWASADRGLVIFDLVTAHALPLVFTTAFSFFVAVVLGPAGKGIVALVVGVSTTVGAVAYSSLHVGALHGHRGGDRAAVGRGLRVVLSISAALLVMAAAIGWSGVSVGSFTTGVASAALVGAALVCVNLYAVRVLQALGEAKRYRNVLSTQAFVYVGIGLAAVLLRRDPAAVIVPWMVSNLVGSLLAWRHVRSYLSAQWKSVPTCPNRRVPVLRSSLTAHAGISGQQLLFRADILLLGFVVSPTHLGYYAVATAIAELVWLVAEAFSLATFAEGDRPLAAGARRARREAFIRANARLTAAGALAVGLAAIPLLTRLVPAYAPSLPLLFVLLPGVWYGGQARILLSSLVAANEQRRLTRLGVTFAAFSLIYVPFIVALGTYGAALGSVVVYVLQTAVVRRTVVRIDEAAVEEIVRDELPVAGSAPVGHAQEGVQ